VMLSLLTKPVRKPGLVKSHGRQRDVQSFSPEISCSTGELDAIESIHEYVAIVASYWQDCRWSLRLPAQVVTPPSNAPYLNPACPSSSAWMILSPA